MPPKDRWFIEPNVRGKVALCLRPMFGVLAGRVSPTRPPKDAFATRRCLYQFQVMPFGLCNAPATVERLMETVLAGLQWDICLIYLDDVIIYGKNVDEMIRNLSLVFDRLSLRVWNSNLENVDYLLERWSIWAMWCQRRVYQQTQRKSKLLKHGPNQQRNWAQILHWFL